MKRRVLLLLLFVLLLSGSVSAFKTFYLLGGQVHEDITNEALEGLIDSWYLEMVDIGNTRQDIDNLSDPNAHFDDMTIRGSLGYIGARWTEALKLVEGKSYGGACRRFGRLLHTVQDFYSHSNYVELHLKRGMAPGNIPPADWNALPAGLRTGYFHTHESTGVRRYAAGGMLGELGERSNFYSDYDYALVYENNGISSQELYRLALDYVTGPKDLLHIELNKDNAATSEGRILHPGSRQTFHAIAKAVAVKDTRRTWLQFLSEVRRLPDGPRHAAALAGKDLPDQGAPEPLFADRPEPPPAPEPAPPPPPKPGDPPPAEILPEPKEDPPPMAGGVVPKPPITPEPPDEPPPEQPEGPPRGPEEPVEPWEPEEPVEPEGAPEIAVQVLGPTQMTAGNAVQLSCLLKGGQAPYSYAWAAPGKTGASERMTLSLTEPGVHTVSLAVRDSRGLKGRGTIQIKVGADASDAPGQQTAALRVELLGPSRVKAGRALTLSCSVEGGEPPYTYLWHTHGKSWSSPSLTLDYDTPGTHPVRLVVRDRLGREAIASSSILVEDALAVNVDGPRRVTVGNRATYVPVVVNGPETGHTYIWEVDGQTGRGASFTTTFRNEGRKTLILSVLTPGQPTYRVKSFIQVGSGNEQAAPSSAQTSPRTPTRPRPDQGGKLKVYISAPDQAGVGEPVTYTTEIRGGSGPVTYLWTTEDGRRLSQPEITVSYETTGHHTVKLEVSDGQQKADRSRTIFIIPGRGNSARPRVSPPPPPPSPPPRRPQPQGLNMGDLVGTFKVYVAGSLMTDTSIWQFTGDGRTAQTIGRRMGPVQSYSLNNGVMTWNGKTGKLTRTVHRNIFSFMYKSGGRWTELWLERE